MTAPYDPTPLGPEAEPGHPEEPEDDDAEWELTDPPQDPKGD